MIGASRTKPGTLNAAVVAYYQSLAFRELAPGTQAMRRSILERLRVKHGNETISRLPPKFIAQSLSRMGPGAARNRLKALRHLLEFAAAEGSRADNPTRGIKLPPHKTDARHTFTEQEIAKCGAINLNHELCGDIPIEDTRLSHQGSLIRNS